MKPTFYLIRHAESAGNVDPQVYFETPDHLVELTETGRSNALAVGWLLKGALSKHSNIKVWSSPYTRARQTCYLMLKDRYPVKEDPRLREQEWGSMLDVNQRNEFKEKRKRIGHFFYRFPNGESGADVYDRCSHFLESVFRDEADAHVIFTHGLTARILAMRILHESYQEFETWDNPENCQIVIIEHRPSGYQFKEGFRKWK